MTTSGTSRREKRRDALLAAARVLFLDKGYERTTIGDIVGMAGGSRSTLMEIFGGKEGLFLEVLRDVCRSVEAIFQTLETSDAAPETTLREFAHGFLAAIFTPETVTIVQILVAESGRFPELSNAFLRIAPEMGQALLAAYLQRCVASGRLRPMDPENAAKTFLGMVIADAEYRALLGSPLAPLLAAAHDRVDSAVDIFLHGAARK
ncbi:putative transcriptional regulator, TetR family [uncultured Alphaproteobacteria bacterium]|uniref:Putative transcriptional regulator, TetR family n=1 Tax=uncultured Alphaproteobacteria bacterium TaxID=91750 RepID=A0A212IUF2_9PROT|nr:putative transcriptional regulator, TetR family [uncultured Alphaproteobacteria bacterium]